MPPMEDEMTQDERDFAAAFEEDMQPAQDGALPAAADEGMAAEGGQDGGGQPDAGTTVVEAAAPPVQEDVPAEAGQPPQPASPTQPDLEKEVQRLKSWEGRLKAMEAKIKGGSSQPEGDAGSEPGSDAVGEALERVSDQTENPALEEAASEMAEAVESGEMTASQAMKQLAEDFGEDFVKMIEAVATAKAREAGEKVIGEKVGELSKTVDEIIDSLVDDKSRAHFKAIADKHPDFNDVGQSPEFKSYIESLPEAERAQAQQVVSGGSSEEVIKLLDGFKASSSKAPSQEDTSADDAMDAAEGVRSSGLVLPDAPEPAADGYAGA